MSMRDASAETLLVDAVNEVSSEDIAGAFAGPWRGVLDVPASALQVTRASRGRHVDSTTVFIVHDEAGRPQAAVLCSAAAAPDFVARAMRRSARAHAMLGSGAGSRVLLPLVEGQLSGLSCAVMPFCRNLSPPRAWGWWQNRALRPVIFDWLESVCRITASRPPAAALASSFEEPLAHLQRRPEASQRLRKLAGSALQRLRDGRWQPRHVLMHGDLWRGNIMVRPAEGPWVGLRWLDRVVVIDWAGSRDDGYPLFDLIKIAVSLGVGDRRVRGELVRHCRLLACDEVDVGSYLAAALAGLLDRLENFPLADFLSMSEACIDALPRTAGVQSSPQPDGL
jgi:hypothetical protein